MNDDERIEQALDEADEAAAATKERLTAEEVFSRIWKTLIEKRFSLKFFTNPQLNRGVIVAKALKSKRPVALD